MNRAVPAVDLKKKHWHPDIHFRLHEYVRYVRVSLNSQYTTEQFFQSFEKMCQKWNVENFTVLEVYGAHDLIIRIFSKQERPFYEDFRAWIEAPAPKMKATPTQWGDYGKCLHHWLWAEDNLALSEVDEALLNNIVESPFDVEARLLEDIGETELSAKNALRVEENSKPGIRFLVFISSATESDKSMPNDAKTLFAETVVNDVLSIDGITHEEIYEGENSDWLIIDARAEFENYFAINSLKTILHSSLLASYGCRITTYLCCNNIEGSLELEKLCATHNQKAPPLTEEDVRLTLERPESGHIEVKGSVQQDLRAFFTDGAIVKMKPKDGVDPVLKTIAGFLNTDGGILIIGAVEEIHFQGVDLSNYPQLGDHRLCGIDSDMDFDKAERTVTNKIRQQISSTASRLCKISYFKIEDKEIMTVEVRRSPTVQDYLGNIYVRENAQTRQLNGAEVAEFVTSRTL